MVPSKRLGQNFLVDGNWIRKVVAKIPVDLPVVEIGPGTGSLTQLLLERGHPVTAVEIDHRLCEHLRKKFSGQDLRLIEGDAVEHPLARFEHRQAPFALLANLPFAITSPWIDSLLRPGANLPDLLFLILQKEGYERTTAPPQSKGYGPTAIRMQLAFESVASQAVPSSAFYPPPGVESRFAAWRKRDAPELLSPKSVLDLRLIFGKRRKMLRHAFRDLPENERLRRTGILASEGLNDSARPEEVPPSVWRKIFVS